MNIPALKGNWVDFIIILFLLLLIWDGWGRGFIHTLLELIVFGASFILALKFYPLIANLLIDNFSFSRGIANAVGFFVLGLILEQILSALAGKITDRIPERIRKHLINQVLTVVPLVVNGLVIVAFFLTLILGLPIRSSLKAEISESKIGAAVLSQTQSLERSLSGIFGEAIKETFNFITVAPVSDEEVKLNFTQRELSIDEVSEQEMLAKVNKERRNQGVGELVMDPKLRDLARVYAKDMFERGYFSHYTPEGESPFDRMEKVGITYRTAGENLAYAPNVVIAHQGLMDSPGHRANILNPDFGKVGIGVIDGGIYGKMIVQEFTD